MCPDGAVQGEYEELSVTPCNKLQPVSFFVALLIPKQHRVLLKQQQQLQQTLIHPDVS